MMPVGQRKAHEAIDHLASFTSSKEEISWPGIELATPSLRFEYLFTIIHQFRVILDHVYTQTLIMSPLFTEHLDIVTQNFETKFPSVKLPRYYLYHPW